MRAGPLVPIASLLTEHGFDPRTVLASAGLDARVLDDPENRIPFRALGCLLATCAKVTGCAHFGLLVGARFDVASLGILGQLMRNSATIRDALRLATLHLAVHDRGAVGLMLDDGQARAALGYALFGGNTPGIDQILDGAMAMQVVLLRSLCGRSWKPLVVRLSRSRPAEVAPYRDVFGPHLAFDARLSEIVFHARWLAQPIAGADPGALAALLRQVEAVESREAATFAWQARRATYAMMLTATASTANLARLFNIHERTLRRRLAAEGATARGLVAEVRRELAHHLLRDTDLSVSEVAATLQYSDVTVFARAFRRWEGRSPSEWRDASGRQVAR